MTQIVSRDFQACPKHPSSNWPSTRSVRCAWTPCRRRIPGTRARRWRWRRWSTPSGSDSCASILRRRSGATVTGSCCRWGTRRAAVLDAAPDRGEVGQPGVRDAGRAVGAARRSEEVPAARLQVPGSPGVPVDRRRGVHDRARWAPASRRASAWRSPAQWQAATFNRPGYTCSTTTSTPCAATVPDGGHQRRGSVAGGSPEARQPVLDLRQQQDHHRGQHGPGVHRGRRHAVRGVRLGGPARRRRERPRAASTAALEGVQG